MSLMCPPVVKTMATNFDNTLDKVLEKTADALMWPVNDDDLYDAAERLEIFCDLLFDPSQTPVVLTPDVDKDATLVRIHAMRAYCHINNAILNCDAALDCDVRPDRVLYRNLQQIITNLRAIWLED